MNDLALIKWLIDAHIKMPSHQKEMRSALAQANPDEITILASIMRDRSAHHLFSRVMAGAYVQIADNQQRYNSWQKLRTAEPRSSSHQSDGTQYGIIGPLTHTILFGNLRNLTWLQLENHPWGGGIRNYIGHTIDFFKYKHKTRNQGPYGESIYFEHFPLKIKVP